MEMFDNVLKVIGEHRFFKVNSVMLFTINSVILDTKTKLLWSEPKLFRGSNNAKKGETPSVPFHIDDFKVWRLPNKNELVELEDTSNIYNFDSFGYTAFYNKNYSAA